jgi:hypothetical protein
MSHLSFLPDVKHLKSVKLRVGTDTQRKRADWCVAMAGGQQTYIGQIWNTIC